jgi:hypothetical protein
LPRSVDEWLNEQVRAGESVDTIRKKLDMTPEEKEAVSVLNPVTVTLADN